MPYTLLTPKRTVFGAGALQAAEKEFAALGHKALIVTGNIVRKGEAFAQLQSLLHKLNIAFAVFSDIPAEPDDAMVAAGVAAYQAEGCDHLIGLGGGSPLDTAKAIALGTVFPGSVCALAGADIHATLPPFALIPTTAGTGSESTRFTVITDHVGGAKLLLKGDCLLPTLAVVDPTFTYSAPPALTAATGMDALTHAVEAYTSRRATPASDLFVLDATKRILASLPIVYRNGQDAAARESMAIAAYEAGVGICNASVTLVHGMSRPIGAHFHVPHGLSNAMLLVPCLRFAAQGMPARFASMAKKIGIAGEHASDAAAADALIAALEQITRALEIPTLAKYGVPEANFRTAIPRMAQEALASGSPGNTLRDVTEQDIMTLYQSLY